MRKSRAGVARRDRPRRSCHERAATSRGCRRNGRAASGERARLATRRVLRGSRARRSRPTPTVDELVRENLDAELLEQPIAATWLGVHAWDDRVDDVRPEAQAHEAMRLRALLDRLRAIDETQLDAARAFDRAAARASRRSRALHAHRAAAARAQPARLLRPGAVGHLRARHRRLPAADAIGCAQINARLWKMRAAARRGAAQPAPDRARAGGAARHRGGAVGQGASSPRRCRGRCRTCPIPSCSTICATPRATPRARSTTSPTGCTRDLLPRAHGDFALGRDRLMELLRRGEGVDVTPELLVALGERELKDARRRLDEAHARGDGQIGRRRRRKLLEEDHGKPEELLTSAQADARGRRRVRAHAAPVVAARSGAAAG